MFDTRTNLSKEVAEEVRSQFREAVFETIIPRNVRLSEAPSFGKPVCYYDPGSEEQLLSGNLPWRCWNDGSTKGVRKRPWSTHSRGR